MDTKTNRTKKLQVYDSAQHVFPPLDELNEIIRYRDLVVQLVRRDIVSRYKRSVLGIAWTMLNPLGMMIILTVVFSQIFKTVEGYSAYVLSGLIAWNFFAQTTSNSISALAWGGDFFRRIYVPRSAFALSSIGTGLVNLVLSLVPLFAVMLFVQVPLRWTAVLIIFPILFLTLFSLGIGLLISSIAIYFPDVIEMYQIVLQAWFYITPIIFTVDTLPKSLLPVMTFNPLYHLIRLFRLPIYEGVVPSLHDFLIPGVVSVVVFVVSWWIFSLKSDEFAYRT